MQEFVEKLKELKKAQNQLNAIYRPDFYFLSKKSDLDRFTQLLLTPGISVTDQIHDQLKELIKLRHPSLKLTETEIDEKISHYLGSESIHEYGTWVHYPWSNRLVHLLNESDFIDVRTSRNQLKITLEERKVLEEKIIGVIGLSVGQSVSVTIAMERICKEIRLADFDLLELTNLNRIRTGIHNLSLAKVYSVAREISEIDPFINVVCFPEGLNEANMNDFFLKNGKLDLLIEESDGFDIKLLSRYKARELKIPVLMEASDRCTVDVERFDLDPQRPILHGLVDHLDLKTLKSLKTTEEKIPYMLDVLGIETSSIRLRASMIEIEQTINTWPQLASAVTMGGGIATDVARRVLLDQFRSSGRFHVDIEELIGDNKSSDRNEVQNKKDYKPKISLKENKMQRIASDLALPVANDNLELNTKQIESLVHAAISAPSGGNSQPWKWYSLKGNLFLFFDAERSDTLLDFENIASCFSLGAAIENLTLRARKNGFFPQPRYFPIPNEKRLICQIVFKKADPEPELKKFEYLSDSIEKRMTSRIIEKSVSVANDQLLAIKNAAESVKGAELHFFNKQQDIEALAKLISRIERLRMMDQRGHHDFVNEIRWTNEENEEKRDGIDLNTIQLSAIEKAGLTVCKNWKVVEKLKQWNKGSALEKLSYKSAMHSSHICLLTMEDSSSLSYVLSGRAFERAWLTATDLGISLQPLSPSTFLFARAVSGIGNGLDNKLNEELVQLKKELAKIHQLPSIKKEIFLFRIFISKKSLTRSLRRNIADQLIYG